jgi:hypothetical protein
MTEFRNVDLAGAALATIGGQAVEPAEFSNQALLQVANTWADHFEVDDQKRAAFIKHYVDRALQQRFWTISAEVDGVRHALCRMEHVLLLFDGHQVEVRDLSRGLYQLKTRNYLHRVRVPLKKPAAPRVEQLLSRFKIAFAHSEKNEPDFDALTSYSKAVRDVVVTAMSRDIGQPVAAGPSRQMRYVRSRSQFYLRCAGAALREFNACLNAEALHVIRSVGCPSVSLYNWLTAGDLQRRIQAVRAFPIFMPAVIIPSRRRDLAESGYDGPEPDDSRSRWSCLAGKLVDDGKPLTPLLMEWSGASKSALKAAQHIRPGHAGSALTLMANYGLHNPLSRLILAASLGNRRPTSKLEWKRCFRLLDVIPMAFKGLVADGRFISFLAGCPVWKDEEWEGLIQATRDVHDIELWPVNAELGVRLEREGKQWNLRRVLNLSARWHEERARVQLALSREDESEADAADRPWQSLLVQQSLVHGPTGVEIVELVLPVHLGQEAMALRHCVDGYSGACYSGRSRIVSLRKDGKSLATAEFCLKPWKGRPGRSHLYCAQLRGLRNAPVTPGSPAGKAFAWLERQIRAGAVPVNVEWPNTPHWHRPTRMHMRDQQIHKAMTEWLRAELALKDSAGIARMQEIRGRSLAEYLHSGNQRSSHEALSRDRCGI